MAEARELFLGDDLSRSDVMSGQNQTFLDPRKECQM